jgi:hypothetical protein
VALLLKSILRSTIHEVRKDEDNPARIEEHYAEGIGHVAHRNKIKQSEAIRKAIGFYLHAVTQHDPDLADIILSAAQRALDEAI